VLDNVKLLCHLLVSLGQFKVVQLRKFSIEGLSVMKDKKEECVL